MGFNTSSVWIKCGIVCLILGTILFVIGFATTAWMYAEDIRGASDGYGLWVHKVCPRQSTTCATEKITNLWLNWRDIKAPYIATRVFECVGLGCQILGLLIMFLFVFMDSMRKRTPLIAIIVLCIVGAICMAIGFIIFSTMDYFDIYGRSIGWSMGVAIAGCCLTFLAGVMAILDLKR